MVTSLSDVPITSFANIEGLSGFPPYREVCRQAAEGPAMFACFREIPTYSWIVSSWIPHDAQRYAELLQARGFDFGFFDRIRDLDRIGGPRLASFPHAGDVAPQTMRYVKTLSDIELLFPSLDGKSVVEIGVGFGGQCAVLSRRYRLARYTLVDLPEPLMLARRYLETLAIPDVSFAQLDELSSSAQYDLVISAYGLSEIARPYQMDYTRRVLQRAASGYLLWNSKQMQSLRDWHVRLYGNEMIYADEMRSLLPSARFLGPAWLAQTELDFEAQLMVWGTM